MGNDNSPIRQAAVSHAGEAAAGPGELLFSAEESGVRLTLTIGADSQRHVIKQARVAGARTAAELAVLDQVCAQVEGRPLQEAADHGVIHALAAASEAATPVAGIRTPRNAGAPFQLAERLVRKVHAAVLDHFQAGPRESRWYLRPSAAWLAKTEAEQMEVLAPAVAGFLAAGGHSASDMWITRIERGTRVTVDFAESVYYGTKPKLLMDLERHLRESTGDPLEVFMEDKKDANKIRRL